MVILFELAVLFSYFHDKRKAARKALAAAEKELADDEISRIEALPEPLEPRDYAARGRDDRGGGSSLSGGSLDDVL